MYVIGSGSTSASANPSPSIPLVPLRALTVPQRSQWTSALGAFSKNGLSIQKNFLRSICSELLPFGFYGGKRPQPHPDKLPAEEYAALYEACDEHLRALVLGLQAEWVIGVGGFAQGRAKIALKNVPVHIGRVLHPSPASPAANRGWAEQASWQMMGRAFGSRLEKAVYPTVEKLRASGSKSIRATRVAGPVMRMA